ncbi:unnamed protein product, partial [Laminaria digitata]
MTWRGTRVRATRPAQTGYTHATPRRSRVMTRRTRIRQPSSPAGLSYGLTTMTVFMTGLVLVDSFNLNLLVDQPLAAKRQHGARSAFRTPAVGSKGCHICRASSRGIPDGGSSQPARQRTASGEALSHQQHCVSTTTAAVRRSSSTAELAASKLAARTQNKGTRTSNSSGSSNSNHSSTLGGSVDSAPGRAGGKGGRYRRERRTEERVRVSAGLGHAPMSRAQAVSAFAAAGAAALVIGGGDLANASTEAEEELEEILVWSPKSEILKRAQATGGRIAPGFNETYPVRFVTYLARFLLNYDKASRKLWDEMANNIPINFSTIEVEAVRKDQFAEFAKAVQVGLLDFQGPQGVKAFFSLMRSRYGQGEDCKRQLAIMFSFLEEDQPTEQIKGLLGEVDNGQVSSMVITDPGGGYTGAVPKVIVSRSQAGKRATARAVLRETGHLVGIRLPTCSNRRVNTYKTPPMVRVSPPDSPTGVQAQAQAILDRRTGVISAIEITNPGSGYSSTLAPVAVEVFGAEDLDESGDSLLESVLADSQNGEYGSVCSATFVAEAIIDREVGSVEMLNCGDGYATSVPLIVEIQSPADCDGRPDGTQGYAVGLVAAGLARDDSKTILPVPGTSLTSKLAQMLPSIVSETLTINEDGRYESLDLVDLPGMEDSGSRNGPGGGNVASSMFDPVFGPVGRSPLEREAVLGPEDYLKLATAGAACNALVRFFLHPLDCVKTTVQAEMGRDVAASGGGGGGEAGAGDGGDTGWIGTVKGILEKGGVAELLRGIDVSTILGFVLGFIGFGGTEFFKRELMRMMENSPSNSVSCSALCSLVWIILLASALAQLVSCAVTCPVEAVRIRVMTCDKRPEFLSFVGTAQEMLDENGLAYFWSGLGALLFRELPFAIAKFLTFELVRERIFLEIPAAQESIFYALV